MIAAWLNHVDAKAINSLDMLITQNGRSFVRHNLIDFGSTLGSGGVGPSDYWEGEQYLVEPGSIGRQLIGFGFTYPSWHTAPFYEAHSIGRLPMVAEISAEVTYVYRIWGKSLVVWRYGSGPGPKLTSQI